MESLHFDPMKTAILSMDFQTAIVQGFGGSDVDGLLRRTGSLLEAARAVKILVCHVVVGFRPGYPEVSPRNQSFGAIRQSGRLSAGTPGTEIHPALAPLPGDIQVTKHRVSAFAGTDLDMILRANQVDTLILAGIATSGVVLSSIRHAADADYRLVVVKDCCGDSDPDVHHCLVEKVFPRQASVVASEAVMAALGR